MQLIAEQTFATDAHIKRLTIQPRRTLHTDEENPAAVLAVGTFSAASDDRTLS
jgi:hypothetical protein